MDHALELRPVASVSASLDQPAGSVISPDSTLASTIRAAAGGDQEAFSRLYVDYVRLVHAIVLGRVPRCEVDDLVQAVFIVAYRRIAELRDPEAFGGWIAAIARNRATDHLRLAHQEGRLPDDLPGGDAIEAEAMAVLDVVRKLPEAYRDTLLMRLVEGMTGAEIADRSGLTPGDCSIPAGGGHGRVRRRRGEAGELVDS